MYLIFNNIESRNEAEQIIVKCLNLTKDNITKAYAGPANKDKHPKESKYKMIINNQVPECALKEIKNKLTFDECDELDESWINEPENIVL